MASVWETLSKVDVSDHTEDKNGLTYLSWAWAWGIVKKHYPNATFRKNLYGSENSMIPYMVDPAGYAFVSVTVCDLADIDWEPMKENFEHILSAKSPVARYEGRKLKDLIDKNSI